MRVIYLGTDAFADQYGRRRMKSSRRRIPRMRSIRNKHRRPERDDHLSNCRSHHPTNINLKSGYSFKDSIEELIKHIRSLINNNGLDDILLQLYEYICTILGYVCSTVNYIEEHSLKTLDSSSKFHSNSLKNIHEICQSVQTLLDCNHNRFAHVQLYSTIKTSFAQFDQNFQVIGSIHTSFEFD